MFLLLHNVIQANAMIAKTSRASVMLIITDGTLNDHEQLEAANAVSISVCVMCMYMYEC